MTFTRYKYQKGKYDIGTLATTMLQWKLGHFFACYNENLGTLLHATMKIWAHFCMLQWKFGHFFSPAKTIFRTLCCMQQRNFWDFYFCNKANFPLGPPLFLPELHILYPDINPWVLFLPPSWDFRWHVFLAPVPCLPL